MLMRSNVMQMAVFLLNECRFRGCGLNFQTLGDLIQHIEDTHIDSDPKVLEKQEIQQPSSLALSYILRCFTDAGRKEQELRMKQRQIQQQNDSLRCNTPTGSEFDEEETNSEDDSDDSWTTQEMTSDLILSMLNGKDQLEGEKPLACPVAGCKKRYKNINGMKYHARHGHKKDISRVKKTFICSKCGKFYKTANGLRNHNLSTHNNQVSSPTELLTVHPNDSFLLSHGMTSSLKIISNSQSNECCSTKAILSETMECLSSDTSEKVAIKRVKMVESNKHPNAIKRAPSTKVNWNSPIMKEDVLTKQMDKPVAPSQLQIKQIPVSIAVDLSLITAPVQ